MELKTFSKLYDISGKVTVVTGGAGTLCTSISRVLAAAGMKVAILDLNLPAAESLAAEIRSTGGEAIGVACNMQEKSSIESAAQEVMGSFGRVDNLINGAGGNKPQATVNPDQSFFDLPIDEQRWVIDLNLIGTILPSQVFGQVMAQQKQGNIINISSMNAFRPLTRIPAYSAAKASVNNFTEWLAVHLAKINIRVNAIAPGFFLTNQNKFLLIDEKTGNLTPRGNMILNSTPMGKFGAPEDLQGTVLYLLSDLSRFVTGVVIPIDGGFNAYAGV